jgi:hypothetical protein
MWKEMFVTKVEVLSRNFPAWTEEKHDKSRAGKWVLRRGVEAGIYRLQFRRVTTSVSLAGLSEHKWDDNFKINFEEIGSRDVNLTELAQHSSATVINIRYP